MKNVAMQKALLCGQNDKHRLEEGICKPTICLTKHLYLEYIMNYQSPTLK